MELVNGRRFSNIICSVCVPVSHVGDSCGISCFFVITIFVTLSMIRDLLQRLGLAGRSGDSIGNRVSKVTVFERAGRCCWGPFPVARSGGAA